RAWVIANFTKSQRLAAYVPGLYNWVIKSNVLAPLVKGVLGFAQDRSLPEVGKTTLRRWIRREKRRGNQHGERRTVYLFCDEFTTYNDVGVGQTAYRLLTALGYEVKLTRHLESGRTYLSKGMLRQAKVIADRKSTRLNSSHVKMTYGVFCLKKKIISRRRCLCGRSLEVAWTPLLVVAYAIAPSSTVCIISGLRVPV